MKENITNTRLDDFVKIAHQQGIDFAKYTYNCDAHNFVKQTCEFDWQTDKYIRTYDFKNFYIQDNFVVYPYFVLSIIGKSYLMYEVGTDVTIWVCYTEEAFRGKGYIVRLLEFLKKIYPEKRIEIDTYDESLRQSCLRLGINLFRR